METKLIHMKCQNCGANLDIYLDHLTAFCPYCGAKLMIDVEKIGDVLIEKEKTNRTTKIFSSVENVADKIVSYKKEKEELKRESEKITTKEIIIMAVVLAFFLIMMLINRV